jgi:3-dehydroquinate dehydratase/shikimate dehydrogenase
MICLVLTGRTIEENVSQCERNRSFIDMVELRVDLLEEHERKTASRFPGLVDLPVILTCRRVADGGAYDGPEKQRLALLESCLDGSFAYVDIEEDVKRYPAEQKARERQVRIIRSLHDFSGIPSDIFHRISRMAAKGDIPKMAVTPHSVLDLITLFRVREELAHVKEKIVLGMGDYGFPSRILYKRLGSMLTYCADRPVAPGQISARMMKELYRADKVDDRTRIYGVIGNPVLHSFSPRIQNPGFHGINFNAIYLPFPVDSVRSFFILAEMIRISGVSVTVPHKQNVLPYLGKITREVKQIGSCNTVVRAKNLWMGTNTDYYGFIEPLLHDIDSKRIQSALVVGAGGAARSVVWALRNHGCKVTVVNRNEERARQLALETMASYDALERASSYAQVDLIVQTTSVGMVPDEDGDPIPDFPFRKEQVVYELVYRPKYTNMLQRARKAGCTLLFGIDMLVRQGKLQFESFTGYHYPKRLERQLHLEED